MLGTAAAIGCLLAGTSGAGDPAPPDEALLEFLGSFSGAEDDADWFEFLAIMSGTAGEDDEQEQEQEERKDDPGAR